MLLIKIATCFNGFAVMTETAKVSLQLIIRTAMTVTDNVA